MIRDELTTEAIANAADVAEQPFTVDDVWHIAKAIRGRWLPQGAVYLVLRDMREAGHIHVINPGRKPHYYKAAA